MNKLLDKNNFIIYNICTIIFMILIFSFYKLNHKHYAEVDINKRRKYYV